MLTVLFDCKECTGMLIAEYPELKIKRNKCLLKIDQ